MATITNRGTGAGGANTNVNGITFEEKTSNETRLLSNGFARLQIPGCKGKFGYCLAKDDVVYVTQNGLKNYMRDKFRLEIFREPDEAYIRKDGDTYVLKVLEKKHQNVEGSVETKLMTGPAFVSEYEFCLGDKFRVEYAFCLSDFLKQKYVSDDKKFVSLRRFNERHGIQVFFGDEPDYFMKLDEWLGS